MVAGLVLSCSLTAGLGEAQGASERFRLDSRAVGATYAIEVVVPRGGAGPAGKLPTVYCTDWYVVGDYLQSLPRILDMGRLTEPHILVGVVAGETMEDWATARTRDFTAERPADEYSREHTYTPALDKAGGSARFLAFLKDELIPLVEARYPADPAHRVFLGYSLGALLGTEILVREPQLFRSYVLGSPSLWFNGYRLANAVRDSPGDRLRSVDRVYLSVGEQESWEMLKGFGLLRDALREKGLTAPRQKAEIVPEAGHVGALPISIYNGLRHVLGVQRAAP